MAVNVEEEAGGTCGFESVVQRRRGQRVARHGPWRCLVRRMTATTSQRWPAEQRKGASVQEVPARQRPESPLKVSWSNNGARGATYEQITHWKNEVVHGDGQRACMSEPEALTSIQNEGGRILPIPVAGVVTNSVPGELD